MSTPDPHAFFARGGAMGTLLAQTDWSTSTLGPVAGWSSSLRGALEGALVSRTSICLWWGPSFVQLYNDAAIGMFGERHPKSAGMPGAEVWSSHWVSLGPLLEAAYQGARDPGSGALEVVVPRGGRLDEAHFSFTFSPIADSRAASGIGGVFATVVEITREIHARRQLATLAELARVATEATSDQTACDLAAQALALNPADFPCAFLYLVDETGAFARLTSTAGIEIEHPGDSLPLRFPLREDAGAEEAGELPVARVLRTRTAEVASLRGRRLPPARLQAGAEEVLILPLSSPELARPYGVLVAAVSPHRALDAEYQSFFALAAEQITAGLRWARARGDAQSAQRAKDEFLATMNHELRTPLTAILGWASMLQRDRGNASRLERGLEVIERNARAEAELIGELLDASRILGGRLELSLEEVELAAVIADAARAVRPAAEARGIALELTLDPRLGGMLADRDRLQQIVWSLLANAVRFSAAGQRVQLRASRGASEVRLEIVDAGAGIASDHLPRVFERFWQGDSSTARAQGGLGLGLFRVRALVEAHGGTVRAESRGPGQGATFTVRLPVRAQGAGDPAAPAPSPGEPPKGSGRQTLQGARVLVIDDEADALEILSLQLEDAGLLVTAVSSGQGALDSPGPFDLMISDIGMPGMDGYAMMRELRARGVRTPALALSAYARRQDALRALEAGYQLHLAKPVNDEELFAAIRKLLAG